MRAFEENPIPGAGRVPRYPPEIKMPMPGSAALRSLVRINPQHTSPRHRCNRGRRTYLCVLTARTSEPRSIGPVLMALTSSSRITQRFCCVLGHVLASRSVGMAVVRHIPAFWWDLDNARCHEYGKWNQARPMCRIPVRAVTRFVVHTTVIFLSNGQ